MEPALILTMPIPHARRRVASPSIDRRDGLGAGSIRSPTFCALASLFRSKAAALEGRVIRARDVAFNRKAGCSDSIRVPGVA